MALVKTFASIYLRNNWNYLIKAEYADRFKFTFIPVIYSVTRYSTQSITATPRPKKLLRQSLYYGAGAGLIFGAGYGYYKSQESREAIINQSEGPAPKLIVSFPDVKITRSVVNHADSSGLQLILFQYTTCPFCCKVRAFLDFYGFSYDVVEVNPVMRQQIRWSDYKKVPILLVKTEDGYQQLVDSSMITSALTTYLRDRSVRFSDIIKCYPSLLYRDDDAKVKSEILNRYFLMYQSDESGQTKASIEEERNWRKWADNVLVHTLSPNVYRTLDEAFQAFNWFSEVGEWDKHFAWWERTLVVYVGACAMWIIGKRLKKRHNLKENVRQSLYDECDTWTRSLRKRGVLFSGGTTPDLADLAVFGVLSSIEGCTAFSELLAHSAALGPWYEGMRAHVQGHAGSIGAMSRETRAMDG